jgi:uncharacterized protein (DUF433 family)
MSLPAEETAKYPHIEINPSILDGQPVIEGTRIPIASIVRAHQLGMDFDEILVQYPRLKPEELHAAFVYYYHFKETIERLIDKQTHPIADAAEVKV